MNYSPITCVWEVTMGCNMRCKHCGSSCAEPLKDELTTEEALKVCDQIADLGLQWVTLSGGEPLTRKDIDQIVKRLNDNGVLVNIITNGWLLTKELAQKLKENGAQIIAISIDGTEELHDTIRKPGAYEHAKTAFGILNELHMSTGAITTISNMNIDTLGELKENLISMGVQTWQVQLGLPMGNFAERPDWVIGPERINEIIDFCYETAKEGRISIFPADCIGYYTTKEQLIRQMSYGVKSLPAWDGCNAGVRSFGILQNGDILGCTSIRNKEFLEGSLRKQSLREIWENEEGFSWRRTLTKEKLSGDCKICNYGNVCLGGCPNTRLTIKKSIYEENPYCSYNLHLKELHKKYDQEDNISALSSLAENLALNGQYQEASFAYDRIATLKEQEIRTDNEGQNISIDMGHVFKIKGFCDYMCGNYAACKDSNEQALKLLPDDAYALKGLGVALFRQGSLQEGLDYVRKAAAVTDYKDQDILNDLAALEAACSTE